MKNHLAIEVKGLGKAYQLGQIGTGTISRDLERFWITKIRRKEDPFLKIGEVNDRTQMGTSDIVWSLKDIDFKIQQGDAVGIIGRNGAGKSTLLKLLSRVTSPTLGSIKVKGRIASLLEVGTGFHPELTGRENIFLNGAILGMRKTEIQRKFDEIVDFSGVERYIDTPVKRYSSGMYVRLAFSVAAHLESEILIVDEVLAVGDAEFQKKCLGKMGQVTQGEGRTILFVSHNMSAIRSLCNKGMLLNQGGLVDYGETEYILNQYTQLNSASGAAPIHKAKTKHIEYVELNFLVVNRVNQSPNILFLGDRLQIDLNILLAEHISDLTISLNFLNIHGDLIAHCTDEDSAFQIQINKDQKQIRISITTDRIVFIPGEYSLDIWLGAAHVSTYYEIKNALSFVVEQSDFTLRSRPLPAHAKMYLKTDWVSL